MGPSLPLSQEIHSTKYRLEGESFDTAMTRIATALSDGESHFRALREILLDMRFLPAGRVQNAMGSPRQTTPYNCFVSQTIGDSMDAIMDSASRAAKTMRLGGGIGYDFSTLRPHGDLITTLGSTSSGPVSFMGIFDAVCKTISSAGHRRGAQMGVLRVDHPDIMRFIHAKRNTTDLTGFNVSVAVTDEFMAAVKGGGTYDLVFNGRKYGTMRARETWDEIMRSTWDWAEPGVLFVDVINRMNNLRYCETIAATNPCAEQPLPPNGACLLGSFNLVKYIAMKDGKRVFDMEAFRRDIPIIVRAMDNVVDRAVYPLEAQRQEAVNKRRMGLGVTGVANALEALGYPYGGNSFNLILDSILFVLNREAYFSSTELAYEKGAFPMYRDEYLDSPFLDWLGDDVRMAIARCGIRNSHLTSIAPTGTISLTADNVSSGIEPVFSYGFDRQIIMPDGVRVEHVDDYGLREFGTRGKTADKCSVDDHLGVLITASKRVDSAVSKTLNVGDNVSWEEFKDIYMKAYDGGAKGCTTYRAAGKRMGILSAKPQSEEEEGACRYDPTTGMKTCE